MYETVDPDNCDVFYMFHLADWYANLLIDLGYAPEGIWLRNHIENAFMLEL